MMLLGSFSLLHMNQVFMEMEIKRPQSFCYKQLNVLVVLFCFFLLWCLLLGWFRNVIGDIRRKNA